MFRMKSNGDGTATISGRCIMTKEEYSVTAPEADCLVWLKGAFVQNAFPNMSAGDREFLISGISPKGWEQTFGPDED